MLLLQIAPDELVQCTVMLKIKNKLSYVCNVYGQIVVYRDRITVATSPYTF